MPRRGDQTEPAHGQIYLGLGANLPGPGGTTPAETLRLAAAEIARRLDGTGLALSPFYSSAAWPDPRAPRYVNAVCVLQARPGPAWLLATLHEIEAAFGRVRSTANAPRPLDLDVIDCNGLVQDGPPVLPHPRAHLRGFVLHPLADLAPHWCHPRLQTPISALIAALPAEDLRRLD